MLPALNFFNSILQVVLESLIVGVRTVTFTCIVLRSPKGAIIAFSAAQMLSITSYVVCFYSYFNYYTKQRRKTLASIDDASKLARRQSIEDEFPFTSIKDFLPSFEGFGTEVKSNCSYLACFVSIIC